LRTTAKIGGCNDCHTAGYVPTGGKVPEPQWLTEEQWVPKGKALPPK